MKLPRARGPLSDTMLALLVSPVGRRHVPSRRFRRQLASVQDPCRDDDFQLALALSYEPLYHRMDDVDPDWEWHPGMITRRTLLENAFEASLRAQVPEPTPPGLSAARVAPLGETYIGHLPYQEAIDDARHLTSAQTGPEQQGGPVTPASGCHGAPDTA